MSINNKLYELFYLLMKETVYSDKKNTKYDINMKEWVNTHSFENSYSITYILYHIILKKSIVF